MPTSTRILDITSQVDGATTAFTVTPGFIAGTLIVVHNGDRLRSEFVAPGSDFDFEENGTLDGFTMEFTPRADDSLQVQFEVENFDVIASGSDD